MIEFKKTSYSGRFPEIWRGECKMLPGGFKPNDTFPTDYVLRRGTPIYVNYDDMSADICKVATVLDGSTPTAIKIAKGHFFKENDVIVKEGATIPEGQTAIPSATISSIDTSNADYDTLTISDSISTAKDSVILLNNGKEPNAVVGADVQFTGKGLPTIDAAYEAVVLYPNLLVGYAKSWLDGIVMKKNPNILFIKQ